jgi:hypothetical protein
MVFSTGSLATVKRYGIGHVSAMYHPMYRKPNEKIILPMHFYLQGDPTHLVFGHVALWNSP